MGKYNIYLGILTCFPFFLACNFFTFFPFLFKTKDMSLIFEAEEGGRMDWGRGAVWEKIGPLRAAEGGMEERGRKMEEEEETSEENNLPVLIIMYYWLLYLLYCVLLVLC